MVSAGTTSMHPLEQDSLTPSKSSRESDRPLAPAPSVLCPALLVVTRCLPVICCESREKHMPPTRSPSVPPMRQSRYSVSRDRNWRTLGQPELRPHGVMPLHHLTGAAAPVILRPEVNVILVTSHPSVQLRVPNRTREAVLPRHRASQIILRVICSSASQIVSP